MSGDHVGEFEHAGTAPDSAPSRRAIRAMAMGELLVEKGVVSADEVRAQIERTRARTPADGARVVARAWTDAAFKSRLLADARSAVAEMGYSLTHDAELAVLENADGVHHVVVCTLCSCYPTSLLGPPPDWYKSFAYRRRTVSDPRAVMREFGLEVEDGVQVRVVDSAADLRYLVLPRRPDGTDGMSEDDLAALVTRDSMIGVSRALDPRETRSVGA